MRGVNASRREGTEEEGDQNVITRINSSIPLK
jgi:hypothetical protein